MKRTLNKWVKAKNLGLATMVLAIILPGTIVQAAAPAPVVKSVPITNEAIASTVKVTYDHSVVTVAAKTLTIELAESQHQAKLRQRRLALAAQPVTQTPVAPTPADVSPEEKRQWVQKAAGAYGIDWKILEAVWQVESGKRWQTNIRSYAGAQGPCQFMPGTWRGYAQDGNGDGVKAVTDARDCLFGAAKLLAVNGAASGNNTQALLRYNHSMAYVNKVLGIAAGI